ncbi:MAG: SDR family NAD(P)-dependent oxidoreductase [Halobacteriales archaeon]
MQANRHDGRVVVVTGASSGIGRATAIRFGQEGANVVCASRNNEPHQGKHHETDVTRPTEEVVRDDTAGDARFVSVDVTDPARCESLLDRTEAIYGPVEVLINNAGIYIPGDSQETDIDDWEKQIGVDLDGAFHCAKHAVPDLKDTSGHLVNIASVNATEGGSGPAYAAANAGLVNLTRDLAVELGEHDVNVNCISPGYVKTPMQDYQDEQSIQESREHTLLPRLGESEDIADVAVFLASDEASFVHGADVLVDGGWTAHRV